MLRLTLEPRPVRVYFVVDKKVLGELGLFSVSVVPPLHRALASGTANIMQSWELAALLNDNLKSQEGG